MIVSVSVLAGLGDHFAVAGSTTSTREHGGAPGARRARSRPASSRRSIVMYDAKTLTVVDALAAEAVEDLFGELVAFLDEQHVLGRSRSARRPSWCCALGASVGVASPASAMSSAMMAPSTSRTSVRLSRFLVRSRSRTAKKRRRMSRVAPVAERAQERGGRELLLLVDVDVDRRRGCRP